MFSRRHLRRGLAALLLVPVLIVGLFIVYQNHFSASTGERSHHHHHPHHGEDHISPDRIDHQARDYPLRSKRLRATTNEPVKLPRAPTEPIVNAFAMPRTPSLIDMFNVDRRLSNVNAVQRMTSFDRLPPVIIHPVIATNALERFVHLDLKGAAPKVEYFEKLFPYLKRHGATGLLIEYEDMFPFVERLSVIRHGLAYSKANVEEILRLAEKNDLKVMPLLQVYGHLEYVLKLKEFVHLREDQRYPQVITPCLEESYKLIFEMVDQMLALHPSIPYLHIGCDEVYYRLVHPQCVNLQIRDDADLFIRHVMRVAKYVKSKRPQLKLFIWHDMVSQLVSAGNANMTELLQLVVPMVWAYVDDIKTWLDDSFWMKFAVFPEIWVASSFKGSSGEITTMSYIGHHQRNQQTWLEAMSTASDRFRVNFTGIALTGWSRYDHMLSLCELLPSSIPSLIYALQTIVHGRLTDQVNNTIARSVLGCNQMPLWERSAEATFVSCTFPGHELYETMYQYDRIMRQYEETMSFVRLYVTDVHLRQNYIHFKRGEECFERLISLESQMIHFIDVFQNTCLVFFTPDIGTEWLQTYFMRIFKEVQQRTNFLERNLRTQKVWPQRPLPSNTSRIVVQRRTLSSSNLVPSA